jgi:hypothetical protein
VHSRNTYAPTLTCVAVTTSGAAALRAAKPQAATPDSWATVLVLAALRARLRGEQALWSDWEVRAALSIKPLFQTITWHPSERRCHETGDFLPRVLQIMHM